jgi:putative SbcD/Mre11-related phosphoesterase
MRVLGEWLLTGQRAALHLPSATAVVADLHLGYGHVRQRGGEAVPALSVEAQLGPLGAALQRHGVRRLVVAGDLLEDGRCRREEVVGELQRWLERAGVELVAVVPGNHDRGLGPSAGLPIHEGGFALGGWRVVHGDGELPAGPLVQGHEHPWVRWTERLSAPCYLVGADRLVLPAYSPDAAGVNVLGTERWGEYLCCAIAGEDVLDFGMLKDLKRGARTGTRR